MVWPAALASRCCSGVGGQVALRNVTGSATTEVVKESVAKRAVSHSLMTPERNGSVGGKAVEQPGAARGHQRSRVAGARRMRGVPRLGRLVVAHAHAVGMAHHSIAFAAL